MGAKCTMRLLHTHSIHSKYHIRRANRAHFRHISMEESLKLNILKDTVKQPTTPHMTN